jgi:hypothetical protein
MTQQVVVSTAVAVMFMCNRLCATCCGSAPQHQTI